MPKYCIANANCNMIITCMSVSKQYDNMAVSKEVYATLSLNEALVETPLYIATMKRSFKNTKIDLKYYLNYDILTIKVCLK